MRAILMTAPVLLALAGCNTADKTADQLGNAADTAGAAIQNGADEIANRADNVVDAVGNAMADAPSRDGWVGRWKGVEGLNLVIAKGDAPGKYTLDMQYSLDDKGKFDGVATADGIEFTRPDGKQVLRATDGDGTGLKYLAGKKDCLKVKDGEGYCRD